MKNDFYIDPFHNVSNIFDEYTCTMCNHMQHCIHYYVLCIVVVVRFFFCFSFSVFISVVLFYFGFVLFVRFPRLDILFFTPESATAARARSYRIT